MNGVKGKFLKKLKSIKPIGYLKQDRIFQAFAPDGYSDFFSRNDSLNVNIKKSDEKIDSSQQNMDGVVVAELKRDTEDGETESIYDIDDKENIEPLGKSKGFVECRNGFGNSKCLEPESRQSNALRARNGSDSKPENCTAQTPLSEIDISSFRRPDMDSGSLFDPDLLAVFHQVVMEHMKIREAEIKCRIDDENAEKNEEEEEEEGEGEGEEEEEEENPLFGFQENCPPGGSDAVIFYTTTLRGIRKTFEDCNSIRFLLETFRVKFYERDISMHTEFKEELWRVLDTKTLPPKLFIWGRYIGGAEEVLGLHEQGKLRPLFNGIPTDRFAGSPCEGCGGIRFVLCFNCNGSRKVIAENEEETRKCSECNENGLILCPYCC